MKEVITIISPSGDKVLVRFQHWAFTLIRENKEREDNIMIVKGSTKRGQELINRASINEGFYISDVYDRASNAKEESWRWCIEKYHNTTYAHDFHICSHNTFQYSVAWYGIHDGEKALFLETANNSYIVLINK